MASAAVQSVPESPPAASPSVAATLLASSSSPSSSPASPSASPSSSPSLSIRFGCVTKDNWEQLRVLNRTVLPVDYSDRFYREAATAEVRPVTHLAFHQDTLVAAICCKFEPHPPQQQQQHHAPEASSRASAKRVARTEHRTVAQELSCSLSHSRAH